MLVRKVSALLLSMIMGALALWCCSKPPPLWPYSPSSVMRGDVGYEIEPGFTADERRSIEDAVGAWNRAASGCVVMRPGTGLVFRRAASWRDIPSADAMPTTVGMWVWSRHEIWLVTAPYARQPIYRRAIAAHELAHALGLLHVPLSAEVEETCMHSVGDGFCIGLGEPSIPPRDRRAFFEAHPECPPR